MFWLTKKSRQKHLENEAEYKQLKAKKKEAAADVERAVDRFIRVVEENNFHIDMYEAVRGHKPKKRGA